MLSKLAIHVNEMSLISNKSVSFQNPYAKSTTMSSPSTKVSALTQLSSGAEEFRELLGLRVHPTNGRFYCGAPTMPSNSESTRPSVGESSSLVLTSACPVLLSLEDSLMWRETLEIWHKSRNLLDSAIYKWAAAMLCDKHYEDERTEVLLWEQIKSRFSGSKYVAKGQQNVAGVTTIWPEMKSTDEALKTLQKRVAAAEAKVAEMASEKSKAFNLLASKEMEFEAMKRLRKATEQSVAQREGALTELRCRNDEMKSRGDALAKKVEEHERSNQKKEEAVKEMIARIEELKTDQKELKHKLDDANRELAETKGSLKELRSANRKLNERYEGLMAQMKDSQETITRQESALSHAEAMSNELREEVKKLRQIREDTRSRLAEQDGALKELRRENKEFREQNASISDQLATARHIIGGHEKELERSKSEAARNGDNLQRKGLERHNAELTNRNKALFDQVQDLKNLQHEREEEDRTFDGHRGDSKIETEFKDQIKSLETRTEKSQEESDTLRAKVRELTTHVKDMEAQLETTTTEIKDLNIEKNSLSAQLSDAQNGLEQHKSSTTETSEMTKGKMEVLRNETRELKAQFRDVEAKLSASEISNTDLDKEKNSLSSELSSVQSILEQYKSESIELQTKHEETRGQHEAATKELEQSRSQQAQLKDRHSDLSDEIRNLQRKLEDQTSRYDAAAKELDEWQAENEELSAANQDLSNKLSNLKNETNAFHTENAKALEHAEAGLQEAQAKTKNLENDKKKMFRQLEILKSELDEERARHQADLSARQRASQRIEQSAEPSIEEETPTSPSKRRSHIWRKLSRRSFD